VTARRAPSPRATTLKDLQTVSALFSPLLSEEELKSKSVGRACRTRQAPSLLSYIDGSPSFSFRLNSKNLAPLFLLCRYFSVYLWRSLVGDEILRESTVHMMQRNLDRWPGMWKTSNQIEKINVGLHGGPDFSPQNRLGVDRFSCLPSNCFTLITPYFKETSIDSFPPRFPMKITT
jgi:hypothetical protein